MDRSNRIHALTSACSNRMICFGVAIGGLALKREAEENQAALFRDWGFRPWLVLPAALAAYALLLDADVGFVPSLVVLIVGCALAHKDVRWRETVLLSICVTAGAIAIFYYGIGMCVLPMPTIPAALKWWITVAVVRGCWSAPTEPPRVTLSSICSRSL